MEALNPEKSRTAETGGIPRARTFRLSDKELVGDAYLRLKV